MKIYLDFDGTVVEHTYPAMGRCNFGCMEVIKKLQDAGHKIILNTYRADCNDGTLEKAIKFLEDAWFYIGKSSKKDYDFQIKIDEVLHAKVHAPVFDLEYFKKAGVFFVDDQSKGIPLKPCAMVAGFMVDWDALDLIFEQNGMYENVI